MHMKSDSEVTSLAPSSPTRSPRRPVYYVQSPSHHDAEKMSFQSSPMASPPHYHCSPIHHSRESSTSRFSASLKPSSSSRNPKNASSSSAKYWKRVHEQPIDGNGDDDDDDDEASRSSVSLTRFYFLCFLLCFVLLFTLFSLILWGVSKSYKPEIIVKSISFESFNVQAGMDNTGVATKMLSVKSKVKFSYRNPASFFGVHVTSTPLDLYYNQVRIASGNIKKFYQSRKSQRLVSTLVRGTQVPLYGGGSTLSSLAENPMKVPLNLSFKVRSRAFVLGKLVKPKFYRSIHCSLVLDQIKLGKPFNLKNSCRYD